MRRNSRLWLVVAGFGLVAASPPDHPEPGLQGETPPGEGRAMGRPYSKGVRVVGNDRLGGRSGNLIMAWSGACAYVAGGVRLDPGNVGQDVQSGPTAGVAVIDAGNPRAPRVVRYLQDKGSIAAGETMHAVTTRGRAVLAASTYGGVPGLSAPKEGWLSLYDVRDCSNPKLVAEIKWPEPVHTLTVSPDGRRVYGTIISPFTGDGGIQVMDISDLSRPRFRGRFGITRPDGTSFQAAIHAVSLSADEKRIYAGVIASRGEDLNKGIRIFPPNADGLGPEAGGVYILDNSDIVEGRTDPKLKLVGTIQHGGWHSPVLARFGGVPHIVSAGELGACPGAWPRITSIADERNPKIVGEFRLAMNRKENCPPRDQLETASNGVSGRAGTAASHFNDVDSATDTRLGLFPMMWAGLRIADLRDPARPVEIAYFRPGDACASTVRYVPARGHIWFACQSSGFWIVELKPEVRRAVGKLRPR